MNGAHRGAKQRAEGTTKRARAVEIAVSGVPLPRWRGRLKRFCAKALSGAGFMEWDISILLCDDGRIAELNGRYRGKNHPTDVLSFPLGERESGSVGAAALVVSGDIAISLDTLRRNAGELGLPEDEELKRLLVHGLLHLAGMDHGRGTRKGMIALQEKLVSALGGERVIGE